MERAVQKVKHAKGEGTHVESLNVSSDEEVTDSMATSVKTKAASSHKGPYQFAQLKLVQDIAVHVVSVVARAQAKTFAVRCCVTEKRKSKRQGHCCVVEKQKSKRQGHCCVIEKQKSKRKDRVASQKSENLNAKAIVASHKYEPERHHNSPYGIDQTLRLTARVDNTSALPSRSMQNRLFPSRPKLQKAFTKLMVTSSSRWICRRYDRDHWTFRCGP